MGLLLSYNLHIPYFEKLKVIVAQLSPTRPEYWSGWLFPSPGNLSNPGIEPRSPTLQADSLPAELPGKPSVQFSRSVMSNSLRPHDCSTPDLPVHYQLPELTQTHVHWVNDANKPSHPLSSPSPPAFSLSQHQDLFQWVSSLHQGAKVWELHRQSFQWIFRTDFI